MHAIVNRLAVSLIGILTVILPISTPASAITAELAKKCRAMAFEAHPPTAIGAKAGTAAAQRDSYRACITNNEKTQDNKTPADTTPATK